MDNEYKVELIDPVLGAATGYFKTRQHARCGRWYATGYIQAVDGRKRSYGCSRDFEVERNSVNSLIQAECAKNVIWL